MDDRYYLQEESVEVDSEDEYAYDEVSVDDGVLSSGDEDLSTALHHASTGDHPSPSSADKGQGAEKRRDILKSSDVTTSAAHPEVVEDFVRNFLVQNGLLKTAECFQSEWYQLAQLGRLQPHQTQVLPDVYAQNRQLESVVEDLRKQLDSFKEAARQCKERYVRIQKERDYHRMHHRRVSQEKNKLIADVKRMKEHFSQYEPLMQQLKHKYQAVTKEKMLASLERDRALSEVTYLQSTLLSAQQMGGADGKPDLSPPNKTMKSTTKATYEFPSDPSNPHRSNADVAVCAHLTRTGGLQPLTTIKAHDYAINSVALHPTKEVLLTASDDHTWKMWAYPSGDLLLSGDGHSDWLSCAVFHPTSPRLATSSGDGTVKLWDFSKTICLNTLTDHQQPVWSCSWHWDGVALVSGSMDHTAKLWDANNGVCMVTLRGHADSVNSVQFLPYSNLLATCSADKTVSLWDARTGLCMHTFYGHQHSCNSIHPTLSGYQLYSADCFGHVLQWDIRTHRNTAHWDMGPFAVNSITTDTAGALVSCASADHSITILDTASDKTWSLEAHCDSVLSVAFTAHSDAMLSTDNAGELIIWH